VNCYLSDDPFRGLGRALEPTGERDKQRFEMAGGAGGTGVEVGCPWPEIRHTFSHFTLVITPSLSI
jgi:hypothetical protein